jgi:hypothetical protein
MTQPLMPKATAVWLVENTALTFDQIAEYCGLQVLEVKGIADGDVAAGIKGMDPVAAGQLSRAEIERCQNDSDARLKSSESKHKLPPVVARKGPRYTPVSRRQDRPDAIAWLLRYHPELSDAQVGKLVGTTKPTIQSVRDRSHWNSANIKPVDPVTLGLCSQIELDEAVQKAAKKLERERKKLGLSEDDTTLLPTSETAGRPADPYPAELEAAAGEPPVPAAQEEEKEREYDPDSVFAKLKDVTTGEEDKGEDDSDR